jgi:transcriptional regulator with XRE-family HTH domain
MSDTPILADLLKAHLHNSGSSARALAERLDASYPSVLSWMSKGGVPRKAEHREALRRELALAPDVFSRVLAASSKEAIDIPAEGPLDLRQLLLRHLGERNLTERTFADLSNIPYATLMGITRRGAVPRGGTLDQLAQALGLAIEAVHEAAGRTRGEAEAAGHPVEVTAEAEPTVLAVESAHVAAEVPSAMIAEPASSGELARVANERVAASGLSAAAYARSHELPYLALSKLLATGIEPEDAEVLGRLRAAFPVVRSQRPVAPAQPVGPTASPAAHEATGDGSGTRALHRTGSPTVGDHPLHDALLKLCRERSWSQQKFAQVSGLAVPTASRLLKGDLPGRGPTHAKLREVLGIDEAAYRSLLPPEPQSADDAPPARAVKPAAGENAETLKLSRAISELEAGQRAAVWQLLKTFLSRS